MQFASKEFDESIRRHYRNRGHIKVSIGVVNSEAQNNALLENTLITYFSDKKKPFEGYSVSQVYATAEQDFSKVDGSMYFLPEENSGIKYYNNGIVTDGILGSVRISFGGIVGLDIKGLTIDFGEYFPTKFTIENDSGVRTYENDKKLFVTEDVFDGTSYFVITPIKMINGEGRLRTFQFTCGIANTFSNEKVKRCSTNEYISPVSETIPSMDTTIVIDNQDLYYSVDNPESAIAYMEVGQEVKITFGYDITGNGDIEWLSETTTYLNTWRADDFEAEFSSTDRFYQLDNDYYGGRYRKEGISLYDLAIEVLNSAGITNPTEYYIDSYLKKIIVYNPIPPSKHSEALQMIANAGRCVLYEDRSNRIHMKSSFVPDMTANSNGQTDYSNMNDLLKDKPKKSYAVCSNDFSKVDGSMYFIPEDSTDYFEESGYVSDYISDENGDFDTDPQITVFLESGFVAYGLKIDFVSTSPKQFKIITYKEDIKSQEFTIDNPELNYITDERFEDFDKMEIIFTKGYPNSRVFVEKILIGDVTNYTIRRKDLLNSPIGVRQQKIKDIIIARTMYRELEETKELISEEIQVSGLESGKEYTVYFSSASYGYSVKVKDNEKIKVDILDSSSFYVHLRFSGITNETILNLVVNGYEYVLDEVYYKKQHNIRGQEISWYNPLISTVDHAKDLEEWLSTYYLGDIDYEISWRGDPRVEANDLFYLELKNRDKMLIRSYQNEMEFNGAWSGSMKARKAVISWQ